MITAIAETNVLLYAAATVGLLGIICRLILSRRYGQLIREASDASLEKKDFMKQLRFKFRTNRKRSAETTNVSVFVKRFLMDYRFMHLRFHQWGRLSAGMFLLSVLVLTAGMVYGYRTEFAAAHMQNMIWTLLGVTAATALVYLLTDVSYKAECLQTKLEDHLCHSGVAAEYQEVEIDEAAAAQPEKEMKAPAIIGLRRKTEETTETRAQKEKRELKTNLAKIKEGMRETAAATQQEKERNREILRQMDSREQERIIRDVLAEFLA